MWMFQQGLVALVLTLALVSLKADGKIVNGNDVTERKYPAYASLSRGTIDRASHSCGASLIGFRTVVTAAHCVFPVNTRNPGDGLVLKIGQWENLDEQHTKTIWAEIEDVVVHPLYTSQGAFFEGVDVALIFLKYPVRHEVLKLSTRDLAAEDDPDNADDFRPISIGFGTIYKNGPLPKILQEAEIPMRETCECMQAHGLRDSEVNYGFICASDWLVPNNEGKGACNGDSGGPLLLKKKDSDDPNDLEQLGVVSFGGAGPCVETGLATVYGNTTTFLSFFEDEMEKRGEMLNVEMNTLDVQILSGVTVQTRGAAHQKCIDEGYVAGYLSQDKEITCFSTKEMVKVESITKGTYNDLNLQQITEDLNENNQDAAVEGYLVIDKIGNEVRVISILKGHNQVGEYIPTYTSSNPKSCKQLGYVTGESLSANAMVCVGSKYSTSKAIYSEEKIAKIKAENPVVRNGPRKTECSFEFNQRKTPIYCTEINVLTATGAVQTIQSSNYPEQYDTETTCWVLSTKDSGADISFVIDNIDTPLGVDFVNIYETDVDFAETIKSKAGSENGWAGDDDKLTTIHTKSGPGFTEAGLIFVTSKAYLIQFTTNFATISGNKGFQASYTTTGSLPGTDISTEEKCCSASSFQQNRAHEYRRNADIGKITEANVNQCCDLCSKTYGCAHWAHQLGSCYMYSVPIGTGSLFLGVTSGGTTKCVSLPPSISSVPSQTAPLTSSLLVAAAAFWQ